MHLPNGAYSPTCAAIGFAAAAAGTGLVWWSQRKHREPPCKPATFWLSTALVLGLQMLDVAQRAERFPVHFLGGIFLAWQLGALRGVGAMALVLAVQALLLGDGSPGAYGIHLLAMGIVPALLARWFGRSIARATLAAALSVVVSAWIVGLTASTAAALDLGDMVFAHRFQVLFESGLTALLLVALCARDGVVARILGGERT